MIHVYTGDGKGKTTAALGLVLRATGAGLRVYIGQFCKKGTYSEIRCLRSLRGVTIEQFGSSRCLISGRKPRDIACARKGLRKAREALISGSYDLVVLDEVIVAARLGLIALPDIAALMEDCPRAVELILTGRRCPSELLRKADLISTIAETRHYFTRGVKARKGIEY